MHLVILLPLVLDLFLPWIRKLLSSLYSSFDLELLEFYFFGLCIIFFLWFGISSFSLQNGIFFFFGCSLHVLMLNVIVVKKNTLWAQQVASFCFYFFFGCNFCVVYVRRYCNGEKNILCTSLVTSHAHHSSSFLSSSLDQF